MLLIQFSLQLTEVSEIRASKDEVSKINSTLTISTTELAAQIKQLENQISTLTSGKGKIILNLN